MCLARVVEKGEGNFEVEFPKRILIRDDLAQSGDRIIYKGRCDLKMNRGGEKFSLELIEEKIQQALGVPVLATALPDLRLGEKLGLCLQSLSGAHDLKAKCKEFVALEFQWIVQDHEIHVLENFPTNANGKWDRRQALECFKI
jgi:acyl-CoA synthetase (AMP-forming)/AMP-acid ligase II